jgi:hypothetical protein
LWIIYFILDTKISEESVFKLIQQKNYRVSISITKIVHAVKGGLLSYCDKVYIHVITSIKSTASIFIIYLNIQWCHEWLVICQDVFFVFVFLEISISSYCSFCVKQQSLTSLLIYQTLFEHWNWKSPLKHRWMVCFRSKKGITNLFFLHEFLILCQIFSHSLMK